MGPVQPGITVQRGLKIPCSAKTQPLGKTFPLTLRDTGAPISRQDTTWQMMEFGVVATGGLTVAGGIHDVCVDTCGYWSERRGPIPGEN